MHLQVPGFALARDQMASIAIGAYCAECRGATWDRVAVGRARRRILEGAIVRAMMRGYKSPAAGLLVTDLVVWRGNVSSQKVVRSYEDGIKS
jgi:hypothetical protein